MSPWIIIAFTLVFSAFFSGMEIAFVSANKLKIELDKKQGSLMARILSGFTMRQSRFIGAMLVGNNIALVIYGIAMAQLLEPTIAAWPFVNNNTYAVLLLQTIISTLIILVTAEFLPKTLFRIDPNRVLMLFAVPLWVIYYVLWLPMIVTIGLSNMILRLFLKADTSEDAPAFGKVDLDHYLREATANTTEEEDLDHEIQIFQNALDFGNVKVRACMIPRTEIVALEVNDSVEELQEKFSESGLSRVLIYRDNIDNIIGYAHSSELFKLPETIPAILLPIPIVPETMPANELLETFIKERRSIAVVVDEFGGTSGIVTMEDVVEEIFGEIEDEHDSEILHEVQLSDNEFELAARIEIDYLNEKYKLTLPEEEEYETLGGLIIHRHESIPDRNDEISIDNLLFRIIAVAENRIERVYLKVLPDEG